MGHLCHLAGFHQSIMWLRGTAAETRQRRLHSPNRPAVRIWLLCKRMRSILRAGANISGLKLCFSLKGCGHFPVLLNESTSH